MERSSENREQIPEFEIKISTGSNPDFIKQKLSRGGLVQFIATKDFDIWLTESGHDDIRLRDDISWDNIDSRGFIRIKDNKLEIHHYDKPEEKVKRSISDSISNFFR